MTYEESLAWTNKINAEHSLMECDLILDKIELAVQKDISGEFTPMLEEAKAEIHQKQEILNMILNHCNNVIMASNAPNN